MISNYLGVLLIVEYIILAIFAFVEGKHPLATYWIGAIVLQVGVVWMSK